VLVDIVPVDHGEEGRDMLRPAVLVGQVVGVLPDVDPEDGGFALADRAVLVWCGHDFQLALVRQEPSPAASQKKGGGVREVLLELVEASELIFLTAADKGTIFILTFDKPIG
jgi:hypothetical protein